MSIKPNPAILAEDEWDIARAKSELNERLQIAQGYNFEVILKDISTVANQPQRLSEWSKMAAALTHEYSK